MTEEGKMQVGGNSSSSDDSVTPLRLLLLGTRGIPANYGGFETFAEQLSLRLTARGHEVTVYGRCRFFERWGARSPFSGILRRDTPTIFSKYLETPVHALTSFCDALFRSYDAAILCNAANSPFAWLLKVRGKPVVINVDGIERNRSKWNALGRAWYRLGEYSSVCFASRLIADANVIADYYQEAYKCPSVVIPYGVHPIVRPPAAILSHFGLQPRKYLLYVSRLEPENNALGVIRAHKQAGIQMPLVIVGDAPYAGVYKALLRQEAAPNVIFTGFQFGEPYEELQSNCYLFIQATEVGGTHPALIEAMSYGNCVVVNGTPENEEVAAKTGVIYEKNNFDQLAAILTELVGDSKKVSSLGIKARERALGTYSWDIIVGQYEEVLREVLRSER